jgi:signal transduction histidine kinase
MSRLSDDMKPHDRAGAIRPAETASFHERSLPTRPSHVAAGSPDIVLLDGGGRIVVVNEAWRNTFAAQDVALRDAGIGALYVDAICGLLPDLDRPALEFSLRRLQSGDAEDVRRTYAQWTVRGLCWRQMRITPLSVGADGRFVAIHDDLTEVVRMQEALQATSEELLTARDEERQRIAIELHDSTSQNLVAAGFGLARLRRAVSLGDLTAIIDTVETSLNEALKETRTLSYLIEPRDLGPDGLSASVRQFVEGFARRTGLEVALEADRVVDCVPPPLRHAALRIIQEALLNAHRHAQARCVSVELGVVNGRLTVSVADDGLGMRSGQGDPVLGVGIPGMQARVRQFSGHLTISSDESGTSIMATLPLA